MLYRFISFSNIITMHHRSLVNCGPRCLCNKARRHLPYLFTLLFVSFTAESISLTSFPILEYGRVVWDLHLKTLSENIQLFTTRITSKQWNKASEHLNSPLTYCHWAAGMHILSFSFFASSVRGLITAPKAYLSPIQILTQELPTTNSSSNHLQEPPQFLILGIVYLLLLLK